MLLKLSKERDCEIIGRWRKACVSHFYWSVLSSSEYQGEVKLAKFQAFLSHVINKHKQLPNKIFDKCCHGVITIQKLWMLKGVLKRPRTTFYMYYTDLFTYIPLLGSEAYEKLCNALNKENLCKAIKGASSDAQTSCLEGYHSVVNQFAPKMYSYSYLGMLSR